MSKQQTMNFQTEVKQMLNLVVHSLYSNKEIFLRELISNGADALDKLRFLALSNANLYDNDSDLRITIETNEKLKTISIKDNGIGMSFDEAIENLGTIAKSGTKDFLSNFVNKEGQTTDSNLIGQFGVGFYSGFIVADKITVKSRRAGLEPSAGIIWESAGEGEFTIDQQEKVDRGTEVILHIKTDAEEFLSDWRLRSIVSKYSDHICWPIVMKTTDEEKKKTEDYETVNKATALWTLSKADITDEEYQSFYKYISHDYQDALIWSHNHVEGKQDYVSLLYIPSHAPYDLWQQDTKHGLKLYIKRVFILDEAAQFLPRYLRFIKGVIDARDLPLNISREILQENKQVESIRTASTKRILSMLEKLSNDDPETYQKFWNEFGLVMKEGPVEDMTNRDILAKLLRFASTHNDSETQDITLETYISRMQPEQDKIYYITASSYNAAKNSPQLEIFKKKGIEVLLLSDRVDEWMINYLHEFNGKKLQSISKGKIELPGEEIKNQEIKKEMESMEPMLKQIKEVLGDKIKEVQFTSRLTNSPVCIVVDENDMGLEMQRILQAAGQQVPTVKPIFEINPEHRLIKQLHDISDDDLFREWVSMLFDQALLIEGSTLDNPAEFVRRVNQLLLNT